ncbi:MAG: hypothetical protein ACRDSL_11515 [Pseudonocardiaceae bacterium]
MARLTRSQWATITVGFEIVPPTLMVALGHPWLGAATLGGVLAASTLRWWMLVRSERDRQRAILSYAQNSATMGGDPATVIAALHAGPSGVEDDDEPLDMRPRGYDPRESGGRDPAQTWPPRRSRV